MGVYHKFLKSGHNSLDKIEKDIHRTRQSFSKDFALPSDSGKNRLFNILKAYSGYDPEFGYYQGINYIAAMILS